MGERYPNQQLSLDASGIDATLLDPSQASILASLLGPSTAPEPRTASESLVDSACRRIAAIAQSLEFKIDRFADGVHRLEQYRLGAERVADRVLESGARRLEERERERARKTEEPTSGATGIRGATGRVDAIDVLRALSRVAHGTDNGNGQESTAGTRG